MGKIIITAAMLLLSALAQAATPGSGIQVRAAWTRATPPQAPSAAGYLTLVNSGAQADRLVSVSSPAATRVELHESRMDGGVMRMRRLEGLDLPAGATVALAPSGTHLMLIGPRQPLVAGQTIELVLRFAHAPAQTVRLQVRPIDAAGPADDMHGMHM
ncbi:MULTISPECIES: copper chaperone PCu(A)C [Pseudoxanthomonas]|uniref:Copper(I)-binding protein n=1 Tax=Pseudoxanthomonas winnipegensis TaxID=2480810 RepID=A0AAW8GC70_9GAMM|nr:MULTISPECIES: copper chaperone PCu(A)C [Pseudoxanthomonas]MDQ1120066.1 copper(I)-binding protein [Pseudoxanthomonas winnipegensis]MDQ1133276.1 copper(I)-binding protein [Pseudoxanthomonas winnipegensis]MDR6136729.1 copper(I)-binding protein [Pseudoxanthomonas sp. SORGH_AS_0997]